jgi:tetratricopeptide (TPR) repeat protein
MTNSRDIRMQMIRHTIFLVILCSFLVASAYAQSGEEWFEIGSVQFENSKFSEAIQSWEKAIEVDPSLEANAYYNMGLAYAGMEQYEDAIMMWEKTVKIAPDSPIAYDNIGTALAILGRNEEALAAYEEAIRLAPEETKFKADRDMLVNIMKSGQSPLSPTVALAALLIAAGCMVAYRRRS